MSFSTGHALLIGVGSYIHHEAVTNLPTTVEDARRLAALLTDPQYCGYPIEQVTVLHDEQATRDGIVAALDHLVTTTTADSTVLIYYAGHGHYDAPADVATRTYFLTTHETDLTPAPRATTRADLTPERWIVPDTAISQAELLAALQRLPAERVLLIFNACHAGELHPTMSLGSAPAPGIEGSNPPEPLAAALLGTGNGRVIMTACRDSQVSQAGPGPTTIFAEYLLAALQGQDVPNRTGTISVFDLYMTVYTKVKQRVLDRYYRHQDPMLTMLRGVGPFPVALYQGAVSMGISEDEAPPAGDAVRLISIQQSQQALTTLLGRMDTKLDRIARQVTQLALPTDPVAQARALLESLPLNHIPAAQGLPEGSYLPKAVAIHLQQIVHRPQILTQIAAALHQAPPGTPPVVNVCGMSGIGKSTVVAAFVYHYGQYFRGGVFWLNGRTRATLHDAMVAAGQRMQCRFEGLSLQEQVAVVQDRWQEAMPRLIVLDGCEDDEVLAAMRPTLGGCCIVLTSQRVWHDDGLVVVPVSILEPDESCQLVQRIVPTMTIDEAAQLSTTLGHFPIALRIAAYYIASLHVSVLDYLAAIASTKVRTLDQQAQDVQALRAQHGQMAVTHLEHIGQIFDYSYQRLKDDALGLCIMQHLAWFADSVVVPLPLLHASLSLDGGADWDAALIRLTQLGFLPSATEPYLHTLLADFLRNVQTTPTAHEAVEDALGRVFEQQLGIVREIVPHIRVVAIRLTQRSNPRTRQLAQQLAPLFRTFHDDETARALYHWVIHTMPDIPMEKADLLYQIGITYSANAHAPAITTLQEAVALHRQYCGTDHLVVATDEVALAQRLIALSQFVEAEALLRHALMVRQDRLPRLDERVIECYDLLLNLFRRTNQATKYAALERQLDQTLHTALAQTKAGDIRLLTTLADHFSRRGNYAHAVLLYWRVLALVEQALGPTHPDTAQCLNKLAYLLQAMGDYAEAWPLLERALAIREQVLGLDHRDTAQSLHNLAALLGATGNYSRARLLYERALAINEQALGPAHPDTSSTLNNLAGLLAAMGDYVGARPLYERALAIREQALGSTHLDTGLALNSLACLLVSMGNYAEARSLYEQALTIVEQALGPDHPTTAVSLSNLANLLEVMGNYTEVRPLYERALAINEQVLGPSHPNTATSLNNLALLFKAMEDYPAAQILLEQALAIREQVLGPTHLDTAISLNNLAYLLEATKDYHRARPLAERALAIREQVLGPDHPDTAISLNTLAALLKATGDYTAARPLYERALAIWEQALGADHPDTALGLNNLAALLKAMGDYAGARPLYERALAITEAALGPDHPTTVKIRKNRDSLTSAKSDHQRSVRTHDRSSEPVASAFSALAHRAVEVLRGTPDEQAALLTQLQRDVDQLEDPRAQFFIWTIAQALQGTPVGLLGHGLAGGYATLWADLVGALEDEQDAEHPRTP